jgi:hypothetical protein
MFTERRYGRSRAAAARGGLNPNHHPRAADTSDTRDWLTLQPASGADPIGADQRASDTGVIRAVAIQPPDARCLPPAPADISPSPDRGGRAFSREHGEDPAPKNRTPWGFHTRGRTREGERARVTKRDWAPR